MQNSIRQVSAPSTLTAVGVADRVGVHRATIWKWLREGLLPQPSIRRGRVVRWSTKQIDDFITGGAQ